MIAQPRVKVELRTNLLFSRRQERILTSIPDQRSPSWVWSSLHRGQCKVRRFLALKTVTSTWNWCLHLYGRSIKIQTSVRNVFDKSFLETVCEISSHPIFNNGQSKHKLFTFKEQSCRVAQFINNVALGWKQYKWISIRLDNTLRKARTQFINEQLTLELDAFRKICRLD